MRRPSTLPRVRAMNAMVNALASAPGRITMPVWLAVKPEQRCRYTGSTNTVAYRHNPSAAAERRRRRVNWTLFENAQVDHRVLGVQLVPHERRSATTRSPAPR